MEWISSQYSYFIFKEQSSDRSNAEIKMVSKNETRDDKYFIVGISILGTGNI